MNDFGIYLNKYPSNINSRNKLLAMIRDSLSLSETKYFDVIQSAYDLSIVSELSKEYPFSKEKYESFYKKLKSKSNYSDDFVSFALKFWQDNLKGFNFLFYNPDSQNEQFRPTTNIPGPELIFVKTNFFRSETNIQWKYDSRATKYQIWRSDNDLQAKLIAEETFSIPRYTDKNLVNGFSYSYYLRSILKDNTISKISNTIQIVLPTDNSKLQIIELRVTPNGIKITWPYSVTSKRYILKRKLSPDSNWSVLVNTDQYITSYTDSNAMNGIISYMIEIEDKSGLVYCSKPAKIDYIKGNEL